MKTAKEWLLGWVFCAACLAACGSDGPGGGGAGGAGGGGAGGGAGMGGAAGMGGGASALPDPCMLLTAAEWAPLMEGAPMVTPRTGSAGPVDLSRCDWRYPEDAPGATRRQWGNLGVAVAGAYSPVPMSQPLDLGDAGYMAATDLARTIDIGWKKGALSATFKYSALVVPAGKDWPTLRDAAIALARQAASRMP